MQHHNTNTNTENQGNTNFKNPNPTNLKPTKKWWVYVVRLVLMTIFVLALGVVLLFYAAGTDAGTQFLMQQISEQTGVKMRYGEGDFRRGLWVHDIDFAQGDIQVVADKAYVQLGWQAILSKNVHLVDTKIGHLQIINHKAPTGEPFDYATIELPITLRLQNTDIKQISYKQTTKDDVLIHDVSLKDGTWTGTKIQVEQLGLKVDDKVAVADATGDINLMGDYPLHLKAKVGIKAIEEVYFDELDVQATGTLRRTVGKLTSRYNGSDIRGEFVAQGLDEDTPFDAKLYFDHIDLPYAHEQQIELSDGVIIATGVPDRVHLRVNADLKAKDIPSGRYQANGLVVDGGMSIDFLQATTPAGTLHATAKMDWQEDFRIDATLSGDGYDIRQDLPKAYQEYQAYLPKTLTGQLKVAYDSKDKTTQDTKIELELNQKDGEYVHAIISQDDRPKAPWVIDARWQNLIRKQLPNIDDLHSQSGQAKVVVADDVVDIQAEADIDKLSVAPKGHYVVSTRIRQSRHIDVSDFSYQGELGGLQGKATIDLPHAGSPLTWQADVLADKLKPNAYFDTPNKTPFQMLSGRVFATGRMREQNGITTHEVELKDTDLQATLVADKPNQTVKLMGKGQAQVALKGGDLSRFDAQFDGNVAQNVLPQLAKTQVSLDAWGDLKQVNIRHAKLTSESGKVSARGKVGLTNGIDWDIHARLDGVNTRKFVDNEQLLAVVSGDLHSTGRYQDAPKDIKVKFDGQVLNKNVPEGDLSVDLQADGKRLVINHFRHQGQAGHLSAKGVVNLTKGVVWDMSAQMQDFDIGAFVKDVPSQLTGKANIAGVWQDTKQQVTINQLDIHGTLRHQSFAATGELDVALALPKDIKAFINRIKNTDYTPRTPEQLLALRGQIDKNARQTQGVIQKLNAQDLQIRLGQNVLKMDGDKSNLTTDINIVDLSQIIANARGAIKGGVILQDDGNSLPTLYVDLAASGVRTAGVVAQEVRALGKINNLGNSPSRLMVEVKDIIAQGQVIKAAKLDFEGVETAHTLALTTQSAETKAQAKVEGGLNRKTMQYQGVLSHGRFESKFGTMLQRQPVEFNYHINNQQVQVAAHCWQATQKGKTGSVCLQDKLTVSPKQGHVNVVVQNLNTAVFSPILPSDISWQSILNGKVHANWQQGQKPTVNAVLYSDNGRVGVVQEGVQVQMPYERVSIIAQSVNKGLRIRTDLSGSAAQGYADITIDPYHKHKPISGSLNIGEINLAVLRPFFPNLQALSGKASILGDVGGVLAKPLLHGKATLQDAQVAVVGVPISLTDLNAHADIQGTQATLTGQFNSGEGQGGVEAQVDWQNLLQARIRVFGDKLDVSSPPLLVAKASPDIEVIVRPTQKYVSVKGVVSVPSAIIRPPEATADIVSESDDVQVLDRRVVGNLDQILKAVSPWSINADIGLDLGDDVSFRGLGAKLPLVGALHLTQSGQGKLQGKGVIQVAKRTTIDGIGQNLELNYAQVRFNGDILNPRLSIEAEKQIEGQTVGVRVKGTAGNPAITVYNDAGLSEQQAMSALVTGRISESSDSQISEQGFRSQVTNNLAAAGLNLGLSGTRNITNQIGQAVGLQSLTIDASGGSDDANVNITGYITPDLYIRYGVGVFNAESTLSMRYQLTRRIYLEAVSAVENTVDAIYRWKF